MVRKGFRKAKRTIEVSVGESVRIMRELQELSQNQLAELSGIPQSTISAIENDRVSLGVERAKSLLATGMSVSEAASSLGFTDQSHLHRYFKRYVRVTPGEYRRWSATEGKNLHAWPGPAIGQASSEKAR